MKVLVADPPFKGGSVERGEGTPNLGILYLVSALRQKIDDVQIHYVEGCHDLGSHLREVERIAR